MPYYCTVPRCTSMAGKAKNVSFHQFPRDEELAKLWNDILKRGKPYTKYSKVCSLHFKPEDYTITSVGKNKGQWRTLRKDAIPSQNLPSDTPPPYHRRQSEAWTPNNSIPTIDPQVQQQIAQAIYMQTMLAIQAAGVQDAINLSVLCNGSQSSTREESPESPESPSSSPQTSSRGEPSVDETSGHDSEEIGRPSPSIDVTNRSYKCDECSKCFKDPDVFLLHRRAHTKPRTEKENLNINTLRSNPILANLLQEKSQILDNSGMEKQLLSIANMETILRMSLFKKTLYNSDSLEVSDSNDLVIDEGA